jgi:hypothetical protein
MRITKAGLAGALTAASIAAGVGLGLAAPASATPPCQQNWELKSDGLCHPYYSTGGLPGCIENPDPNGDSMFICGSSRPADIWGEGHGWQS